MRFSGSLEGTANRRSDGLLDLIIAEKDIRGLGGVVGLMLPLALAAAVRVPYTTSPCSDLGQVVNLSLSVA